MPEEILAMGLAKSKVLSRLFLSCQAICLYFVFPAKRTYFMRSKIHPEIEFLIRLEDLKYPDF